MAKCLVFSMKIIIESLQEISTDQPKEKVDNYKYISRTQDWLYIPGELLPV